MQQLPVLLDLCLKKTWTGKSYDNHGRIIFGRAPFSKCFLSTPKREASILKFLRLEERFPKAPFS